MDEVLRGRGHHLRHLLGNDGGDLGLDVVKEGHCGQHLQFDVDEHFVLEGGRQLRQLLHVMQRRLQDVGVNCEHLFLQLPWHLVERSNHGKGRTTRMHKQQRFKPRIAMSMEAAHRALCSPQWLTTIAGPQSVCVQMCMCMCVCVCVCVCVCGCPSMCTRVRARARVCMCARYYV